MTLMVKSVTNYKRIKLWLKITNKKWDSLNGQQMSMKDNLINIPAQ